MTDFITEIQSGLTALAEARSKVDGLNRKETTLRNEINEAGKEVDAALDAIVEAFGKLDSMDRSNLLFRLNKKWGKNRLKHIQRDKSDA